MRIPSLCLAIVLLAAGCGVAVDPARTVAGDAVGASAKAKGTFTSGSFEGRGYKLYEPAGAKANRPLLVMLHGCLQDPDDFAAGTRMNAIADKENFLVLYPLQTKNDHPKACMPWYEPGDNLRGRGMAGEIAGIVEKVVKAEGLDRKAIFLAGMSAGGAYASTMAVLYPDLFAAVGVHSGLEFGAAVGPIMAITAMKTGGPLPSFTGPAAYMTMGSRARVIPAIVVHGTDDKVVYDTNGDQVARQFAIMNNLASKGNPIDTTPDVRKVSQVPDGYKYTRSDFNDKAGNQIVSQFEVQGLGHAWSGGDKAGSYTDPKGPDASVLMWAFFDAHRMKK